MTQPENRKEVRLDVVNPSPTVHTPPPEVASVRRLSSRQVGVVGTVIVDLILAQVALALGGIDILGVKPFAFLTTWGREVQLRAAEAYNQSLAAEAVANSADANQAIALGQVSDSAVQLQETQTGLQTTWNSLWEANTGLSTQGVDKDVTDVKTTQNNVRLGVVGNGDNIQGTWDNIYNGAYNDNASGRTLNDVFNINRAIVVRAGLSDTNQGVLGGNIQSTWDSIYVGAGGTGPASGNTLEQAGIQLSALTDTAVEAAEDAEDAFDLAETVQILSEAYVESGSNLIANYSFEQTQFYINPATGGVVSTEQARTGSRSLKVVGGGYSSVSTTLYGLLYLPASDDDIFYIEAWVRGSVSNNHTVANGIEFGLDCVTRTFASNGTVKVTFDATNALRGVWTKLSGTVTVPANTALVVPRLGLSSSVASSQIYYFDDVVVREVTLAQQAKGAADAAQVTADGATGTAKDAKDLAEGATAAAKDAQDAADLAQGNVEETWDQTWENTYGAPPPGEVDADSYGQAVKDTSDAIDKLDGRITDLETTEQAVAVSGESFSTQFSVYTNGSLPNPPWAATIKSGSNGATVSSGKVTWTGGSVGSVAFIYNTGVLSTANQVVTVSASTPKVILYGRATTAAATTTVYATVDYTYSLSGGITFTTNLYAVNSGSTTLMRSQTVNSVAVGSSYNVSLICGETINGTDYPRNYKVVCNGVTILSHTDVSTSNLTGRYCGFGMSATLAAGNVLLRSAAVSAWSCADTKPATYLGAGTKLIRDTTTATSTITSVTSAVGALLPSSVFNTVAIAPNTGTMTAANGAVTVLVPGWYAVDVHLQMGEGVAAGGYRYAGIYVGGSPHCWGTPVGAFGDPPMLTASTVVYCAANTVIAPAYRSNQNFTVVGEPSGYRTSFSVAFLNNTKPVSP